FGALGVYGASVVTALTAQNTQGVSGIHDVPADFITAQLDAVFSDLVVDAVKIGMLSQAASIEAVARGLADYRAKNIVLDPVMVATYGDRLLAADAVDALRKLLIPRALVITPNLPEAAALVGASSARNEKEMEIQARELLALGARNVLIKGGHGTSDDSVDLLIGQGDVVRLSAKRIATMNLHGTGCTLSSAIPAGLDTGLPPHRAARAREAPRAPPRGRRAARRKPMSPARSRRPLRSKSATVTDRCTISISQGETYDDPTQLYDRCLVCRRCAC